MSSVKRAVLAAVCIALCCVLPPVFHMAGLGAPFSPMHLAVLLCGLLCGWPYGLFCGVAGPLLSSLLFGMPLSVQLVYQIPEHLVYGLVSGLLYGNIKTGRMLPDTYLALIPAMLLGRLVGGAGQAAFYLSTARAYSVSVWASAYLVGTLPGVVLQLVLMPLLLVVLTKAGLVPRRYPKKGVTP